MGPQSKTRGWWRSATPSEDAAGNIFASSIYIDSFINPLVRKCPSFTEGSTDVLNRITNLNDIWSHFLYYDWLNIRHFGGRNSVYKYWPPGGAKHYLSEREESVPPLCSFYLNVLLIIYFYLFIENDKLVQPSYFFVYGWNMQHKIGVSMGSCFFSPSYTCSSGKRNMFWSLFTHSITGVAAILMMCSWFLMVARSNQLFSEGLRNALWKKTRLLQDKIPHGQFQCLLHMCKHEEDFFWTGWGQCTRELTNQQLTDRAQSVVQDTLLQKQGRHKPIHVILLTAPAL